MIKHVKTSVFILFASLVLSTPLLVAYFTNEKYETPKVFFVYSIGLTIMFLFSVYRVFAVKNKKLVFPHKPALAFLCASVLSTIFSTHFYTSFWGYYTRFNDSLFSYLIFFGIYFVAINFLNTAQKRILLDLTLLTLLPTGAYGLYQIMLGVPRIYSTFGQPNWYAAYLIMLLPLVMYKIISTRNKLFWSVLFLLGVANLVYTASLSGIAGFIISTSFFIVYFGKKLNPHIVFFLLCVFLLFGVLKADYIKNKLVDAVNLSGDSTQYALSDPGYVRLGLWKSGLKIAVSSPKNFLIGTGLETFAYQLPFYRDNSLNYSSEWNYILNKPHNYYLEVFIESGILGLVSYLALLIWSMLQKDKVLVAGLLGFYVSNFFGFPTIYTNLLFWLWLAFNTDTAR